MNALEKHIVTGMVTDMNVSRFDATKVFYARNARISTVNDKNELFTVMNEKGPLHLTGNINIPTGTVVGSAFIDEKLILFIKASNADYIYRLTFPTDTTFNAVRLYQGNLGFDIQNPLETLSVYENENVQKVYWVDGVHQLRSINVVKDSYTGDSAHSDNGVATLFDVNPVLTLNHTLNITKRNTGGDFPAGTIQYAFTYFNMYSPETPVFEVSEQYLLSPQRKGAAADGRVVCSFNISLSGLDTTFEYLRAYAIIRTSENATPAVRLLGDFRMSSGTVNFVDDGAVGSTVDASYLLFVGGEPVAPSTFTVKDNTLFLGNIRLLKPQIGTIIYEGTQTIAEKIAALRGAGTIPIRNVSKQVTGVGSETNWYNYTIDNNRKSTALRRFKKGETYRLGIIAQHKTGVWSEVLWIGDYTNDVNPIFKGEQTAGIWELTSLLQGGVLTTILSKLKDAGFLRVAPVAVYPEGIDRTVFCQGLVSATVYNVEDRYNNKPFSQASWFFRPISEGFGIAASPHAMLYQEKETTATDAVYGNAEIQLNQGPRLFLPFMKGTWQGSNTQVVLPNEDMVSLCKNDYYIDTSIVTLNSPDIEFNDSLQQEDFEGLKFRIVGIAKSKLSNQHQEMYADITAGLYNFEKPYSPTYSKVAISNNITYHNPITNFLGYLSHVKIYNVGQGLNSTAGLCFFALYPWHKTGKIQGSHYGVNGYWTVGKEEHFDPDNNVEDICILKSKIISNIRYGVTEMLGNTTNVQANTIKLFDDTQNDFIPLSNNAYSEVYYGNIDSVRVFTKDSLSSTNAEHSSDTLVTKSVSDEGTLLENFNRVLGYSYYPCMSSIPFNNKEHLESGYVYMGDTRSPEEVLKNFPNYRNTFTLDNTPVPIKYKSTKHAVVVLSAGSGEIPSLYRNEALVTAFGAGSAPTVKPFWKDTNMTFTAGKVPFYPCVAHKVVPEASDASYPFLYIGELYRDNIDPTTRFGGNSEKAILNNVWKRCGEAVYINLSNDITIKFEEGDTYLTRYDCLKTYPYADNDVNSIVEIFSTDIETRVNLDARYDHTRGLLDNTLIRPENINLVNRAGYEQSNQFFTFTAEDYSRENVSRFPNLITISEEKVPGASVDVWGQINLTGGLDLDGTYGEIHALKTFNNDVYAFQTDAFSNILFNSRVQIPTSDGQPIEITNGMKLQGVRYLSNTVGCQNKWSICSSSRRLYWFDNRSKDVWGFSGQGIDNLSTRLGVKSWFINAPSFWYANGEGFNTFFDKRNSDVYFSLYASGSHTFDVGSLMFSENLDTFVSVFDYTNIQALYNLKPGTIITRNNGSLWSLWKGNYNNFFGTYKPFYLRFIANMEPTRHKVFNTLQWRSDSWNNDTYVPGSTFNKFRVWNQYQDSGTNTLVSAKFNQSNLKKKFNTFRALVPRDSIGTWNENRRLDRIRGNYAFVELKYDLSDNKKIQFYDLEIGEFIQ